jgi:hypothetical protein
MFSRIRRRITFANVAMTLALVFAMSGGALAASKYLITSTKQIKPSVLTALKGKTGAAGKEGLAGKEGAAGKEGPKGANGTNGTEGPKGANGTNGTNGSNGESVTASAFSVATGTCTGAGSEFTIGTSPPTFACNGKDGKAGAPGAPGAPGESVTTTPLAAKNGSGHCEEGGAQFEAEPSKGKVKSYACAGSPWTAGGTLPSGQSETGTWGVAFNAAQQAGLDSISFTIPLKTAPLQAVFVNEGAPRAGECEGTLAAPTAEPGYLCVYLGKPSMNAAEPPEPNVSGLAMLDSGTGTPGAGTTGAIAAFQGKGTSSELAFWTGTWAVTAK